MDWSLVIFIVVVLLFVYRGYQKGLLGSLSRIVSLVAGYVVAIFYTEQVAAILDSQYQLQGVVWLVATALILFFATAVLVNILFWLLAKLLFSSESSPIAGSLGGATVGLVIGFIAAIVIVWTFMFVRDMRQSQYTDTTVNTRQTRIESLASRAASKVVHAAMSMSSAKPEITNLSAALIASPAGITQHAQRLSSSNDLNALLNDPETQELLNRGDVDALRNLPALQQLARNPDLLALAKSAGMLDDSHTNPKALETALASQITDIWQRMNRVRNDQRVQQILNDPEFQQKIQSGNPIDLLTNDRLLELADIIFGDETEPDDNSNDGSNNMQPESNRQKKPEEKVKIHSWIDDDGRIHFSDTEEKP